MKRMCMKIVRPIFAALLFIGTMGSYNTAFAANGIILEQEMTPGSYCHLKFPAIDEASLSTKHPFLKNPDTGDIIDFYGPCDHDPLGKDEINAQRLDLQHRRQNDYES